MELLNQRSLQDSSISSECELIDKNGRHHIMHIKTTADGRHNIVVDYGGIDKIGYGLSDDGLVKFLARLFGRR